MNFNMFQWSSLKTRATIATLTFFLVGIWSLAFYSRYTLQKDMVQALSEQQFSTVSIMATDINTSVEDRLRALEKVATRITPAILGDASSMQRFLEARPALEMMFNAGVNVTRSDGIVIADVPISMRRIGINYSDRNHVSGALKGKSTIGNPVVGKMVKAPIVPIAVPILDKGKVIGTLTGITNLAVPNFLSNIMDNSYGKTGNYLLVSRPLRTIVFATDKKRIMELLPAPGINPLIDRYIQGYEGSGITIRPNDGVEILSSAKSIPVAGWYVVALMSTEEAFAPIQAMQKRMLLAAIFLTLLASGVTWWVLKRQLEPVFTTIKTLATLSDTDQPPQPLHITRQDEIGQLIGGFNRLLDTLAKRGTALRESEEKYRRLHETMAQGVVYQAADGQILSANPAAERILGLSLDQLLGKTSLDPGWKTIREDGSELPGWEHPAMVSLRTGRPVERFIMGVNNPHRDSYVWISIAATPLFQPGETAPFQVYTTFDDITERKRAEEELRASHHFVERILESTPNLIYIYDLLEHRNVYANREVLDFLGYTPEQIKAFGAALFQEILHPDDAQLVAEHHARFAAVREGEVLEIIYRMKHADGEFRWLHSRDVLFTRCRSGEGQQILGSCEDITERKRAELEKAKLQDQLLQSRKMESVGRLAGGVAHDFNNMLGVIIGRAEIALGRVDTTQPIHADLQEILKAAERSADLTRQLLAFARKQVVAPKVLELNDIVAGMLKMLHRLIGENLQLVWIPGVNLWPVEMDPSQIDQMLVNLCINARDAVAGVGKVAIETGNIGFDEAYCADHEGFVSGEYVLLAVSDDGCGMDKATADHIFEPFFTTKEVGKGTGLGLATVYGIVKQNNGFINVYSEPDQGTTFKMYLPRHKGKAEQAPAEGPQEPIMRGQETILLVEDEPTLLDLGKLMLEIQGYRVLPACTPGEAIRLAEEHAGDIHLLMTDVVMPEMNGRDLAKQILSLTPKIKCLFTSGYTANVIVHHGVLDENVHFIQKPFSRRDLAAKVREALNGE